MADQKERPALNARTEYSVGSSASANFRYSYRTLQVYWVEIIRIFGLQTKPPQNKLNI